MSTQIFQRCLHSHSNHRYLSSPLFVMTLVDGSFTDFFCLLAEQSNGKTAGGKRKEKKKPCIFRKVKNKKLILLIDYEGTSPCRFDPMDCSPPGSSVHGILQARGWHFLLQGIFSTQGLNLGPRISGRFFTV